METSNTIVIRADYDTVFRLGADVVSWARILPHYRYVRLLKQEGDRKWVKMSARRDIVPVTWTAIQTVEWGSAEKPGRIYFEHIGGLVRGMRVQWVFAAGPHPGEVRVTIEHELEHPHFPVKILGPRLIDIVVGRGFIGNIAGKTLARIKYLAEREASRRPA